MNKDEMLPQALAFAYHHHDGQEDLAGLPYILHPLAVLTKVVDHPKYRSFTAEEKLWASCIAILHDVVEDTDATLADVDKLLGCPAITAGVEAMTHWPGEPLTSYWQRAKANKLARLVKICDFQHNSSPDRAVEDPADQRRRLEKYTRGMAFMEYGEGE